MTNRLLSVGDRYHVARHAGLKDARALAADLGVEVEVVRAYLADLGTDEPAGPAVVNGKAVRPAW